MKGLAGYDHVEDLHEKPLRGIRSEWRFPLMAGVGLHQPPQLDVDFFDIKLPSSSFVGWSIKSSSNFSELLFTCSLNLAVV